MSQQDTLHEQTLTRRSTLKLTAAGIATATALGAGTGSVAADHGETASITVPDHTRGDQSPFHTGEVRVPHPSVITVRDSTGTLVGSDYVPAGIHANVFVTLNSDAPTSQETFTATLHRDTNGSQAFEESEDTTYADSNGNAIEDSAVVSYDPMYSNDITSEYYDTITVLDENGDPIEGATVTAVNYSAVTDANGQVEYDNGSGTIDVTVSHDGYEDTTATLDRSSAMEVTMAGDGTTESADSTTDSTTDDSTTDTASEDVGFWDRLFGSSSSDSGESFLDRLFGSSSDESGGGFLDSLFKALGLR